MILFRPLFKTTPAKERYLGWCIIGQAHEPGRFQGWMSFILLQPHGGCPEGIFSTGQKPIRLCAALPNYHIGHRQTEECKVSLPEETLLLCILHEHILPVWSLTQVLRVDEWGPTLRMGPSTPDGPPAALLMVELATGDVHLMHGGVHPLRQHARTVGVHVETDFVANDGLVYAALVALALVVRLQQKRSQS